RPARWRVSSFLDAATLEETRMRGTRAHRGGAIPDQNLKNRATRARPLDAGYVIGDIEIELAQQRMRHRRRGFIHLARQPFRVLLYLVANRRRLVTRAELLDRFWDGRDVYEDALTRAVSSARKALG